MTTPTSVTALARAFATGLRRDLTLATLADIDAINAETGDGTCASHEFMDADGVMDSAFAAVMGRAFNGKREADCTLWNAAWSQAKAAGFATLAREANDAATWARTLTAEEMTDEQIAAVRAWQEARTP